MEDLDSIASNNMNGLICTQEPVYSDIISNAECKQYLNCQEMTDEKVNDMKNNLVGIVNSVISFYLESFK